MLLVLHRVFFLTGPPLFSTKKKIGQRANQKLPFMKTFMWQQLWLARSRFSFWYWKGGGPVKKTPCIFIRFSSHDAYSQWVHLFGCYCLQTPVSRWHISSDLPSLFSTAVHLHAHSHLHRSQCTIFSARICKLQSAADTSHHWGKPPPLDKKATLGTWSKFSDPKSFNWKMSYFPKEFGFKSRPRPKCCCFPQETFENTPCRKLSRPFVPPCHSFMTFCLITKTGVKYLLDKTQFDKAYCVHQKSHHWKKRFSGQILEVW